MKNFGFIFMILFILLHGSSCTVSYSFTGAAIPENINSFNVKPFRNNAANAPAPYGQEFAEALKDRILSQTKLSMENNGGDVVFEGSITGYNVEPIAVQSNEEAAQNRLTISVRVSYLNTKDPKKSFETSFSRFSDYDSGQSLSSVEDQLLTEINEQITLDIFNQAFNDW